MVYAIPEYVGKYGDPIMNIKCKILDTETNVIHTFEKSKDAVNYIGMTRNNLSYYYYKKTLFKKRYKIIYIETRREYFENKKNQQVDHKKVFQNKVNRLLNYMQISNLTVATNKLLTYEKEILLDRLVELEQKSNLSMLEINNIYKSMKFNCLVYKVKRAI
jgi:hypothetical protein